MVKTALMLIIFFALFNADHLDHDTWVKGREMDNQYTLLAKGSGVVVGTFFYFGAGPDGSLFRAYCTKGKDTVRDFTSRSSATAYVEACQR